MFLDPEVMFLSGLLDVRVACVVPNCLSCGGDDWSSLAVLMFSASSSRKGLVNSERGVTSNYRSFDAGRLCTYEIMDGILVEMN